MDTLVLGMGNPILRDDGVGIYVVRQVEERLRRDDVAFVEASVGGVRMILDRELAVGDEVTARITTPQRESLERVRVVWMRALPDGWLVGCAWAR